MGSRWSVRPRSSTRGCASCPMRFAAAGASAAAVTKALLDPGFRGARLLPIEDAATGQAPLDVKQGEGSAARCHARRSRVWRGTAAADRRSSRRRRRGVPHHRRSNRTVRPIRRRASAPPSATTSSAPERRRTASSTSASGRWDGDETRQAGRSFDGRPRRIWSAARDTQSSPRSPRRRSVATTRSAASSTSISTRGWRRSTRC